jgi:hypothetical protein
VEVTARIARRRPGKWTLLSGISLIAVGVLSFNAYASFTATASYDQAITSGTMTLVLDDEDSATIAYNLAGSNLAAGDTMQRALSLTFGGTVTAQSLTLGASDDGSPTALVDGTANGMTIIIETCDQPWDETVNGGIPTYDCAGTDAVVLSSRTVDNLIDSDATLTGANNLTLTGENHLRVTWTLPSAAGNAFQGLSDTVSLSMTSNQRNATNK